MNRSTKVKDLAGFIWGVADLLRGDYKQADYGKVILPFTVLRRLDCVLEPTKDKVMTFYETRAKALNVSNLEPVLNSQAGLSFHNISKYDFQKLKDDPDNLAANLKNYINGFSNSGREIMEYFRFNEHIDRLDNANLLLLVLKKFAETDLHPDAVSSLEMGYVFEELIRKFSELSNETAGEHFTPREVIRLMVNVLLHDDTTSLQQKGVVKTIYDPACGTGGMLSSAEDYIRELNEHAKPVVFGQEINPESYAICKSDMLIKGQNVSNIKFGNTFTSDGLKDEQFDYMFSNPPFGVEWRKVQKHITDEYEQKGFAGRFGAGLPRISDGSLLFLQHMLAKMKPKSEGGSRIGIVFNGSPLFSGGAGSGESNIRKWIIENDWLETIIALPDQLFYNTGIYTYIWILSNDKMPERRGKVQLINAVNYYQKMSRSLGNKRNEIGDGENGRLDQIAAITEIHGNNCDGETRTFTLDSEDQPVTVSKIFDNEDFGYQRITVERPLRLNFQASEERLQRLDNETAFANLATSKKKRQAALDEIAEGQTLQADIKTVLQTLDSQKLYKNRDTFERDLNTALRKSKLKLNAPLKKAVMNALSERDESADTCTDKDGQPEPDTQLRDFENVPLKDDINAYFEREVLPHVPDAWIDESKTVVGYEISFTKYFYQYKPLRPLSDIRAEIMQLEQETEGMLRALVSEV